MTAPATVQPPRGLWLTLDEYAKSDEGQRFGEQLRDIFGHLFSFTASEECENFIRNEHHPRSHERIFLIVQEDFLLSLVKRNIHHLRLVEAIFVYHPHVSKSVLAQTKYDRVRFDLPDVYMSSSLSPDRRFLLERNRSTRGCIEKR